MKKREPIDDLFQDRLKDFSLEAPMHLWDNIAEAAVPEPPKRKHKGLLWLWLLPLLMLTGIGWAYFGNYTGKNQIVEVDSFPIPRTIAEPTTVAQTSSSSTISVLTAVEKQPLLNSKNVTATTASKTAKSSNQENLDASIIADARRTKTTNSVDGLNSNSTVTTQDSREQTINSTATIALADPNTTTTIDESNNNEAPAKENPIAAATDQQETTLPYWLLEPLSGPLLLVDNPIGDEELSFPAFEAKSWLTTVDLMASMDFVMRQLDAKDPNFDEYARLRDNTETFRHGVSVGMRLSTISESGFAVRSGLNYSAINEQLNFKIKEEEKLTITTKYDVDGSIIGADTSIQVVGTYRIVNNRYTELDIPLLIGYEYVGDKISFSFNGGIFINMLSAQKGEFVSPNSEEPVSFSSSDPNSYRAFKNRVGLGFYGSMGIYLQVKDNFQVLLEPYAKWRPGSYTVDGYVLDQRFLTTGLFVGVRKRII